MLKLLVQFWQIFKSFYCLTNLQFTKSLKSHLFSQKAIYYDVILMKWFCRLLILFVWIRPRVIMKKKLKSAESCFKRYILGCKYRIGIPTWVLLHLFALGLFQGFVARKLLCLPWNFFVVILIDITILCNIIIYMFSGNKPLKKA